MKKTLVICSLVVLLAGCLPFTNMPGTVKGHIDNPEFQAQNQPYRGLKVLLYVPSGNSELEAKAMGTLQEVSDLFLKQTGIYFQTIEVRYLDSTPFGFREMLRLGPRLTEKEWYKFDIAIFIVEGIKSVDLLAPIGMIWFGVIEDTYRRFIYIRSVATWVIAHELGHAFILDHGHSTCLMASGLFVMPYCHYFTMEDWKEIQRNKWRDFSVRPDIPPEYVSDRID